MNYEISKQLNISDKLVSKVVKRGTSEEIHRNDSSMTYNDFLNIIDSKDERIFVPIEKIEEVSVEPVYDFTTISDNHSFYANGFIVSNCLYETPDGEGNGLVKNLAASCYISLERDPALYQAMFRPEGPLGKYLYADKMDETNVPFLLNGKIQGWCIPEEIIKKLKVMRRKGSEIQKDVCIFYNDNNRCVEMFCDGGRPTRPLFVVDEDQQIVIKKKPPNKAFNFLSFFCFSVSILNCVFLFAINLLASLPKILYIQISNRVQQGHI
jgi:hypothetical protein